MLACRFQASRNVAFGAAMLAVLAGIWLGHGDLNRIVFSVLVCLLVSFRLVTLALGTGGCRSTRRSGGSRLRSGSR